MPVFFTTNFNNIFCWWWIKSTKVTVNPTTANVADTSYTFILHNQSVATMTVQNPAGGNASKNIKHHFS